MCGARLAPDVDEVHWCGQCHAPLPGGAGLAPAAPSPEPPAGRPLPEAARTWLPPERPPRPVHSRWHAGPTTFGPSGRIGFTVAVLLAGWFLFELLGGSVNPLSVAFFTPFAGVCLVVLRAVWRRDRIL